MKECPNCHRHWKADANFCSTCGSKLAALPPPLPKPREKRFGLKWLLWPIALFGIFIAFSVWVVSVTPTTLPHEKVAAPQPEVKPQLTPEETKQRLIWQCEDVRNKPFAQMTSKDQEWLSTCNMLGLR